MNEKGKYILKRSRNFSIILLIVIIIISIFCLFNIFWLVYAGMQNNSNFSIAEEIDDSNVVSSYLTVNNKDALAVDAFQVNRETGLPNYKASYMLNRGTTLINQIIFIIMLLTVYKMLREMTKKECAFTLSNAKSLRIISLLILMLVFVPSVLELMINFFIFFYASVSFTIKDILLILVSLAVWGISYVMDYGFELQKEVNETL